MSEADSRQRTLESSIAALEHQTRTQASENSHIVSENRSLLTRFDTLSTALLSAESRAESLQHSLDTAESELLRTAAHAARTDSLLADIARIELEREALQSTLSQTAAQERQTRAAWKSSQLALEHLEQQLATIEELHDREQRREENRVTRKQPFAASLPAETYVFNHYAEENLQLRSSIVELQRLLRESQAEIATLRQHSPQIVYNSHHHYHAPPPARRRPPNRWSSGTTTTEASSMFSPAGATDSRPTSAESCAGKQPPPFRLLTTTTEVPEGLGLRRRASADSVLTLQLEYACSPALSQRSSASSVARRAKITEAKAEVGRGSVGAVGVVGRLGEGEAYRRLMGLSGSPKSPGLAGSPGKKWFWWGAPGVGREKVRGGKEALVGEVDAEALREALGE